MFLIVLNLGGGAPASHDRPPARDVSTVSLRETLFGLDDERCMVEKIANLSIEMLSGCLSKHCQPPEGANLSHG